MSPSDGPTACEIALDEIDYAITQMMISSDQAPTEIIVPPHYLRALRVALAVEDGPVMYRGVEIVAGASSAQSLAQ